MKRKFALFYVLITSLCFAASAFIVFHALGYRVNRSASLPFLVYEIAALTQDAEIKRSDYVIIDLRKTSNPVIRIGVERGYVNLREPMLKQIGAVPGDTIVLADGFFSVNGQASEMNIAAHDSFGGDLYAYPTPITLPPNQYWLVSDPERGFDSRYFGPVNGNAFTHRAYPVF